MDVMRNTEHEQATLWNGVAGRAWVDAQPVLDQMFRPLEELLIEEVSAASAARVLDVGCGTGSTTLAVARRAGTRECVGIDISDPMIAVAHERAERESVPARFICADAQSHAFAAASFDMIISRLGVMFFEDCTRAFFNLRRAARDDAVLRLIAWRSAAENQFMTTAERAAAPLLPDIPARRPDGPGQFAFADRRRVQSILDQTGWGAIHIQPIDVVCTFHEKDLVLYLTRLGPLGRAVHDADERTRQRVIETVRPAFDPYVHGAEVRFQAACWMIGARAIPVQATHV
jgi:SAM-dependent methyltransferase